MSQKKKERNSSAILPVFPELFLPASREMVTFLVSHINKISHKMSGKEHFYFPYLAEEYNTLVQVSPFYWGKMSLTALLSHRKHTSSESTDVKYNSPKPTSVNCQNNHWIWLGWNTPLIPRNANDVTIVSRFAECYEEKTGDIANVLFFCFFDRQLLSNGELWIWTREPEAALELLKQ